MANIAGEKMLQAVRSAKESASRAGQEYDRAANMLQIKAQSNIDLFGGSAVSQVADIANESRKICDALYATYQMLVNMLDEECRPLLEQNPEIVAVREVRDLIKWLNNESEIENNFSASLNSQDLGRVVSGRYIPSIENKMIQSYWENKYHMWPGRAEAEEAERRKKEEAEAIEKRKKAEQAEKSKQSAKEEYLLKMSIYEKEYAEWQLKVEAIQKRRSDEVETRLTAIQTVKKCQIEKSYAESMGHYNTQKNDCIAKMEDAQAQLATLGSGRFFKKMTARKIIRRMEKQISIITSDLNALSRLFDNDIQDLNTWIEYERERLELEMEHLYPFPSKPKKPYPSRLDGVAMTAQRLVAESLRDAIWEFMSLDKWYTIKELMDSVAAIYGMSMLNVKSILDNMYADSILERDVVDNQWQYRLKE